MAYFRKLIRLEFISHHTPRRTNTEITEVIANLIRRRGFAGALEAWPTSGSSDGELPHGRTTNSTVHQMMK